jgi:predicted phage terminase large subunit-like protein
VRHLRGSSFEVETAIKNAASLDGKHVRISIPQDPGQAGKAQAEHLVRQLAGYIVKNSPESGDKATRAEPVAAQAEAGNVKLVRAPWNDAFLAEAADFPNGAFKDQIDALSRAFAELLHNVPGMGVFEYYKQQVEAQASSAAKATAAPATVRRRAPHGHGAVSTMSGHFVHVGADGTIELSLADAEPLERLGWQRVEGATVPGV